MAAPVLIHLEVRAVLAGLGDYRASESLICSDYCCGRLAGRVTDGEVVCREY